MVEARRPGRERNGGLLPASSGHHYLLESTHVGAHRLARRQVSLPGEDGREDRPRLDGRRKEGGAQTREEVDRLGAAAKLVWRQWARSYHGGRPPPVMCLVLYTTLEHACELRV